MALSYDFLRKVYRILGLVLLIALGAVLVGGVLHITTARITFRPVTVLEVRSFPGEATERLVTVDLEPGQLALRTGDRLLWVEPGGRACLQERELFGGRWIWRSLVLPGYCRTVP